MDKFVALQQIYLRKFDINWVFLISQPELWISLVSTMINELIILVNFKFVTPVWDPCGDFLVNAHWEEYRLYNFPILQKQ